MRGPSTALSPPRLVVGALGLLVGLYGAWLLLSRQDLSQLTSVVIWLVGGLLLHDVLISGGVLGLGALLGLVLSPRVRGPVVAGLVVLGSVTLLAVPVLGRFGAKADNPSLLDRNYLLGWLVLALLVALGTGAGVALRSRRRS